MGKTVTSRIRGHVGDDGHDRQRRERGWKGTAQWQRERLSFLDEAGWMCQACRVPHPLTDGRDVPEAGQHDDAHAIGGGLAD